jgi:hypothetical protein
VGKISDLNDQLNAVIPKAITGVITERANALSMTKGKFAAQIIQWWWQQGCPPVTKADNAVIQLSQLSVAEPISTMSTPAEGQPRLPHEKTIHPKAVKPTIPKEVQSAQRNPFKKLPRGSVTPPLGNKRGPGKGPF